MHIVIYASLALVIQQRATYSIETGSLRRKAGTSTISPSGRFFIDLVENF